MKKHQGSKCSRILFVLTLLVLGICLMVACGGGTDTENPATDAATDPTVDVTSAETEKEVVTGDGFSEVPTEEIGETPTEAPTESMTEAPKL